MPGEFAPQPPSANAVHKVTPKGDKRIGPNFFFDSFARHTKPLMQRANFRTDGGGHAHPATLPRLKHQYAPKLQMPVDSVEMIFP